MANWIDCLIDATCLSIAMCAWIAFVLRIKAKTPASNDLYLFLRNANGPVATIHVRGMGPLHDQKGIFLDTSSASRFDVDLNKDAA